MEEKTQKPPETLNNRKSIRTSWKQGLGSTKKIYISWETEKQNQKSNQGQGTMPQWHSPIHKQSCSNMKMGISAAHCYSKNVTHSTSRHGMERTSSKCGSEIDLTKSEIDLLTKSCSPRFGWWGAISVSCILLSAAEWFAEMHRRERLSKFGIDGKHFH